MEGLKGKGREKEWRKRKEKEEEEKEKGEEKGGWDIFNLHNFVDLVYSAEPTDTVIGIV